MLRSERSNFFPQHREKKTLNVIHALVSVSRMSASRSDGGLLQKHHARRPRASHVAPSKREIQRAAASKVTWMKKINPDLIPGTGLRVWKR